MTSARGWSKKRGGDGEEETWPFTPEEMKEESGEDEENNPLQFGKGGWRWRWQEGGRGEEALTCSGGGVDRQHVCDEEQWISWELKGMRKNWNLLCIYTLSPPGRTHSECVCVCVCVLTLRLLLIDCTQHLVKQTELNEATWSDHLR